MATKQTHFTVRGSGRFPIDMLRYDGCWPFQSTDSFAITHSFTWEHGPEPYEVRLETWQGKPTVGRWRSFGWDVKEGH